MGLNKIIELGDNIRKYRLKRGYTQKQFAEKLGISYSTYSNYENNNRTPNTETLETIAKELDVELYALLLAEPYKFLPTEEEKDLYYNLDECFEKLNLDGKNEALKRVQELTIIPMYTTKD